MDSPLLEEAAMEVREAVAQINTIWLQVARTEQFRGYRPATVAGTGILGLLAALAQYWIVPVPQANLDGYLLVWTGVAIACVFLVGIELWVSYLRTDSPLERHLTRQAVQQFVPCLCGGAAITWVIADYHLESVGLLPGLWATCFGLGVFASLPYVTPAVFWVGLYYLVAGSVGLACGRNSYALHPWLMGGTFGVGQLLMAVALLTAEERRDDQA
jgi:hypothetical protein